MKFYNFLVLLILLLNLKFAHDDTSRTSHPIEHPPPEIFLKVLLVEFFDVTHDDSYSRADFDSLLFSTGYYITDTTLIYNNQVRSPDGDEVFGSLRDYFLSMSNGQFSLTGGIINNLLDSGEPDWIQLDTLKELYDTGPINFKSAVFEKTNEANIDTTTNDSTKLVIIYAGNIYVDNSLNPKAFGIPGDYYIMGEKHDPLEEHSESNNANFSHIGIHQQEFLHLIGLTHTSKNITGSYCGMNERGTNNGPTYGACPASLNPYYRYLLGWIEPIQINSYLTDQALIYNPGNTQSYINATTPYIDNSYYEIQKFYVIENRQFSGPFDLHLPFPQTNPDHKGGLLLWQCEESILPAELNFLSDIDWYVYNANLITANGLNAWTNGDNYNVFFPGDNNEWTEVNDYTSPSNTNLDNDVNSFFMLKNISPSSDTMSATFYPNYAIGDINSDSIIDILDIIYSINFILQYLSPTDFQFWAADMNEDNTIDITDINAIVSVILQNLLAAPESIHSNQGPNIVSRMLKLRGGGYVQQVFLLNQTPSKGGQFAFRVAEGFKGVGVNAGSKLDGMNHHLLFNSDSTTLGFLYFSETGNMVPSGPGLLFEIDLQQEGLNRSDPEDNSGEFLEIMLVDSSGMEMDYSVVPYLSYKQKIDFGMDDSAIPSNFSLYPVYPNPFNPVTTIKYDLPEEAHVSIIVYDILGKNIQTLVNTSKSAGSYSLDWNADVVPSGVYFVRMLASNKTFTQKVMVLK